MIVFDVITPDADHPDAPPLNEGHYLSTTERSCIVSGLLRTAELYMSSLEPSEAEE